jgi:hypothetical protein
MAGFINHVKLANMIKPTSKNKQINGSKMRDTENSWRKTAIKIQVPGKQKSILDNRMALRA